MFSAVSVLSVTGPLILSIWLGAPLQSTLHNGMWDTCMHPTHPTRSCLAIIPRNCDSGETFLGRVSRAHNTLVRNSDGRYFQTHRTVSTAGENEDNLMVVCIHHVDCAVQLRHMPLAEWRLLCDREGVEVQPGQEGRSSIHLRAPPSFSTLPFRTTGGEETSLLTTDPPDVPALISEAPLPVFDYIVAPQARVHRIRREKHRSLLGYVRYKMAYSKDDLHRIEMEDRRCLLSVERRHLFLQQYQRDLQCRQRGVPLYVTGVDIPNDLVPMFFLLVAEQERLLRRQRVGRRHLGHGVDWCRELIFPHHPPADGYVIVTVGSYSMRDRDADALYWEESVDEVDYGGSAYTPRDATTSTTEQPDYVIVESPV